ncbi:unnamed protein product [Nezara viridula]|uniref:Uncharacterized protein n=1 Tax=Nezara viridula TaxID=85310 RepID=A0A9P0H1Y9_NEZVI|nr:unnamed protein product [Nezara viridula]
MPLFLLYLSNIGDILAKSFKWTYAKCCLCTGCQLSRPSKVRIPPDGILGKDKTYFSSFRTAVDSNQNNWGHTTGEHLAHDHYVCNRRTAKRSRPPAHIVIA